MVDGHETVTREPTPFQMELARCLIRASQAMAADLREMAEGRYTGRHSQAFLDGSEREA